MRPFKGNSCTDLAAHHLAERRILGLQQCSLGRDFDGLRNFAYLQVHIHANRGFHVYRDLVTRVVLEARLLDIQLVGARDQVHDPVAPSDPVLAVRRSPVPLLVNVTVAFGTMAPLVSLTVPTIEP